MNIYHILYDGGKLLALIATNDSDDLKKYLDKLDEKLKDLNLLPLIYEVKPILNSEKEYLEEGLWAFSEKAGMLKKFN